jgi:DNA-binding transcriptional MocR family regulator
MMGPDLSERSAADLTALNAKARSNLECMLRPLGINLTRGIPAAEQLDLVEGLLALPGAGNWRGQDGTDCRNYGGLVGLPEARRLFAGLLDVPAQSLLVGGNSSLALMHDCIVFALLHGPCDGTQPWFRNRSVAFLCPVPGYDRHFAICESYGIEMIPVPLTESGPDMELVESLVAADPSIRGMWCVPKYSNPTGITYSTATIERLARMRTAATDFRLFWDNAYVVHHLTDERVPIADILSLSRRAGYPNRPFIFGSTSKITFPGSGLALFASSRANLEWLLSHLRSQTIGQDKINQLRHVRFLRDEASVRRLMDQHRAIIAPKFEKVLSTFDAMLGGTGIAEWSRPKGGYFISLDVLDGCATRVVALAKEVGVELTPAGATHPFRRDPRDRNIRIAPTFPPLQDVPRAAEAIASCVLFAATELLLRKRRISA